MGELDGVEVTMSVIGSLISIQRALIPIESSSIALDMTAVKGICAGEGEWFCNNPSIVVISSIAVRGERGKEATREVIVCY